MLVYVDFVLMADEWSKEVSKRDAKDAGTSGSLLYPGGFHSHASRSQDMHTKTCSRVALVVGGKSSKPVEVLNLLRHAIHQSLFFASLEPGRLPARFYWLAIQATFSKHWEDLLR
jgi:hypothetical protein